MTLPAPHNLIAPLFCDGAFWWASKEVRGNYGDGGAGLKPSKKLIKAELFCPIRSLPFVDAVEAPRTKD